MTSVQAAFDDLALQYDVTWTHTAIGQLQREAVWRHIQPLVRTGDRALDLGCGTGEDAVRLGAAGASVSAIDASPRMVQVALTRGVDASVLKVEDLDAIDGEYDLVLSNFGVLNCVNGISELREPLARLVRSGGHLAVCFMGRFCLWETAYHFIHGAPPKAIRRWRGQSVSNSLGIRVFYPRTREVLRAFAPKFALVREVGIAVTVPPSYVGGLSNRILERLARLDRRIEEKPIARSIADHQLLIFQRRLP
jgi:ubiquinone/menaquinone biosynthesis C-methylase UbiE